MSSSTGYKSGFFNILISSREISSNAEASKRRTAIEQKSLFELIYIACTHVTGPCITAHEQEKDRTVVFLSRKFKITHIGATESSMFELGLEPQLPFCPQVSWPISASVATVAMRQLEYNLQLFWQFQQEMTAKVSAAEPSRKSSRVIFI